MSFSEMLNFSVWFTMPICSPRCLMVKSVLRRKEKKTESIVRTTVDFSEIDVQVCLTWVLQEKNTTKDVIITLKSLIWHLLHLPHLKIQIINIIRTLVNA